MGREGTRILKKHFLIPFSHTSTTEKWKASHRTGATCVKLTSKYDIWLLHKSGKPQSGRSYSL